MSFIVIPEPFYEAGKQFCENGFGSFSLAGLQNFFRLYIDMQFELYIGFDKATYSTTTDNNSTNSTNSTFDEGAANETAQDFAAKLNPGRRNLEEKEADETFWDPDDVQDGRRLDASDADSWRFLADKQEDPCVILTMSRMQVALPVIGGINLAKAVGGYCNFEPEVNGKGIRDGISIEN